MHALEYSQMMPPSVEVQDPRTHRIIGAAMEVHSVLGHGFLEAVYQEALALEFNERSVPNVPQRELPIVYKGRTLKGVYRADFVCFGEVIVELKALAKIGGIEQAQILNYLRASGLAVGLILNFGTLRLEYRRVVLSANLRPSATSAEYSSERQE